MTKKQIVLPNTYVGAQPPNGDFDIGWADGSSPAVPEAFKFGPVMFSALLTWEKTYRASLVLIDESLGQELKASRSGLIEDIGTKEGIYRELSLREALSANKQFEISELSSAADQFYGVDPLSMSPQQQMNVISRRMSSGSDLGDLQKFSQISHKAAYKRSFAIVALTRLGEQSAVLREKLAQIQIQEAALAAAEAAAIAQAQAAAEAAAIAQAQAAAEAAAIAQAQAAVEAQIAQAEAERLKGEQRYRVSAANTFRAEGKASAAQAQILVAAGTISAAEGAALTLQAAIRATIAGLAELVAGTASGLLVGVSALLYSTKLGNGELPERFALTLPLADLGMSPSTDLYATAGSNGTAQIPVRIGFREGDEGQKQVIVIPAGVGAVSTGVPVIAAQYHAEQNVYSVSVPEVPGRTLVWTPAVVPSETSTVTLPERSPVPVYEGAIFEPVEGRIDTFPEVADAGFEDYIFVFPADSGIPPLYAVFATPRDFPGIASGVGQPVSNQWLAASSRSEGAAIPVQIAEQLRGKEFKSFRHFREAFWKLVAADPVLEKQFIPQSLGLMRKGYAPKVERVHAVGGNRTFEVHHVIFISSGGEVYDMDNLRIMTPKRHVEVHAEVRNG